MSVDVTEQLILDALHKVPREHCLYVDDADPATR